MTESRHACLARAGPTVLTLLLASRRLTAQTREAGERTVLAPAVATQPVQRPAVSPSLSQL